MITMEKLISETGEGADSLADVIIALMKRTYEIGYECGYAAGNNARKVFSINVDLDNIAKATEEGYVRGREDGYDEACMDLTDDDLCGVPSEECGMCFGASFGDCDECLGIAVGDCPWK